LANRGHLSFACDAGGPLTCPCSRIRPAVEVHLVDRSARRHRLL